MNVKITVRGIHERDAQKSESIRNYVSDSLAKLQDLILKEQQPVSIEVLVTVVDPHPSHEVEIHIRGPRYNVIVQRKGAELYKVIDDVADIAFHEVVKHKEKFVDDRRREGAALKELDRSFKSEE